jgi:ribosomal-protein-alanine N-acetyltransferase
MGTVVFWKFEFDSYRAELGYIMNRRYQGNGYMLESIQRVLQYGFEVLGLHSLEARVDPENVPSVRVLEKTGFVREGYLVECSMNRGQYRDNIIFSLLKRNYKKDNWK